MDNLGLGEGEGGGFLDGEKLTGVGVTFEMGVGLDDEGVAAEPAEAPTCHVEAFGKGVEFDSDIFSSGGLEDREGGGYPS